MSSKARTRDPVSVGVLSLVVAATFILAYRGNYYTMRTEAGQPQQVAWLGPISIELLFVWSLYITVRLRHSIKPWRRRGAWAMVAITGALSVEGQILHARHLGLSGAGTIINAMWPLLLMGAVELLILVYRNLDDEKAAASDQDTPRTRQDTPVLPDEMFDPTKVAGAPSHGLLQVVPQAIVETARYGPVELSPLQDAIRREQDALRSDQERLRADYIRAVRGDPPPRPVVSPAAVLTDRRDIVKIPVTPPDDAPPPARPVSGSRPASPPPVPPTPSTPLRATGRISDRQAAAIERIARAHGRAVPRRTRVALAERYGVSVSTIERRIKNPVAGQAGTE